MYLHVYSIYIHYRELKWDKMTCAEKASDAYNGTTRRYYRKWTEFKTLIILQDAATFVISLQVEIKVWH